MPRPRMFKEGERTAINIYLHKDQLDYLKQRAIRAGVSPSRLIRDWLDQDEEERESMDVQ